ncbi:MAG: hypothetical protein M1469_04405 [Bacteroidetes bacterium]|nr:hypothetical protein [Bacteroidota bacterium]
MKSLLSCLLLLTFSIGVCNSMARSCHQNGVSLKVSNNRLNVKWGGNVRLSGGTPLIQNMRDSGKATCRAISDSAFAFRFRNGERLGVVARRLAYKNVTGLFLITHGNRPSIGKDYIGLFFDKFPGYKQGISYWFMQDWNAWTKPMKVKNPADFPDHGVQFFLWQYRDGTYGAAMPLSGEGYETALGRSGEGIGAKAVSGYDSTQAAEIPMLAIGFGKDPYVLISELYHDGLSMIGRGKDLRVDKKYPEILDYFGWCTWNASDLGKNLSAKLLLSGARSFYDHKFPLSWIIIDDGWLQNNGRGALTSYRPKPSGFPEGFKPVIRELKKDYGIKYVGVWHTIDGYWNGIDTNSAIGRRFRNAMFSWTETNRMGKVSRFDFISPYSDSLSMFYDDWYQYLRAQGVDFVKVDNQLSVPDMARGNFPVFDFAERIHSQLNRAVDKYFGNTMINCMDMGNDAYYNFGSTAVARNEEDYFPYEPGESYNMMRGNTAVHVLNAVTNSLWFGQMVYSDYDEFESYNPNATFHAIARAISDGPVYVTDKPGKQNFNVLFPLVYRDGRIIRTDVPARPTRDCLFQVQDPKPFKAFSRSGKIGLIAIWNVADTNLVAGTFKPSDVHGIRGKRFLVYEYFSKSHMIAGRNQAIPVKLGRFGYRLYYVSPIKNGFAPVGLTDKYNAPGTIESCTRSGSVVTLKIGESGPFTAYSSKRPKEVKVNNSKVPFKYVGGMISVNIKGRLEQPVIRIVF